MCNRKIRKNTGGYSVNAEGQKRARKTLIRGWREQTYKKNRAKLKHYGGRYVYVWW